MPELDRNIVEYFTPAETMVYMLIGNHFRTDLNLVPLALKKVQQGIEGKRKEQ